MFIGHFALGFASKGIDKRPSLGTMFIAVQWLDLLWPVLILTGVEKVKIEPGITELTPMNFEYYPWSHSLLMAAVWGILFALIYSLITKNTKSAILLFFLVLSHWLLDYLTHRPDLPLTPFSEIKVGLGLWNYKWPAIIIETIIFILGIFIYLKSTQAKNKTGIWAFWSLVIFLLVVHFGNLFGPPPTDVNAIGWVGLSQWLLVAWAYWIDRNRV
jgi:membrane-bound metal-dependent hydrolase YbcI (DUF457 family)